jgi:hypothetical protein
MVKLLYHIFIFVKMNHTLPMKISYSGPFIGSHIVTYVPPQDGNPALVKFVANGHTLEWCKFMALLRVLDENFHDHWAVQWLSKTHKMVFFNVQRIEYNFSPSVLQTALELIE